MPQTLPSQALEHIPDDVLDKHPEFADVLAVAFTDQNGNHTYEPGTDTLIASLLDINNDHVVSVGDLIHWGTYPTTIDVDGPRGNFTGPDLLVEGVGSASSSGVEVQTALGNVAWAHVEGARAFDAFATAAAIQSPGSTLRTPWATHSSPTPVYKVLDSQIPLLTYSPWIHWVIRHSSTF
jgi:hypothetical protein